MRNDARIDHPTIPFMGKLLRAVLVLALIHASNQGAKAAEEKPDPLLPDAPVVLSFKAREITDELVLFVAKVGAGKKAELPRNADLLAEITARCGKVNATGAYLAAFVAANPALQSHAEQPFRMPDDGTVVFPECIFADEQVTDVPVTPKGPLWQDCRSSSLPASEGGPDSCDFFDFRRPDLGKLQSGPLGRDYAASIQFGGEIGASALNTVTESRLADPAVRASYQRVFDIARSGSVPLSGPESVSAALAPAVPQSLASAIQGLKTRVLEQDIRLLNTDVESFSTLPREATVSRPAAPSNRQFSVPLPPQADTARIINAVPEMGANISRESLVVAAGEPVFAIASNDVDCDASLPDGMSEADWPLPLEALERVMTLNEAIVRQEGGRTDPAKVLVIDTGFPSRQANTPPLRAKLLLQNRDALQLRLNHPDLMYLEDWLHVMDFTSDRISEKGIPYHKEGHDAFHGMNVVSLALGGVGLLSRKSLEPFFRYRYVMPANAYELKEGKIGAQVPIIEKAVSRDGWKDEFKVVNLSLKILGISGVRIQDSIKNNRDRVLYIVAAGNSQDKAGGADIKQSKVIPAVLGGPWIANVMTVAAIEPSGKLAKFSHFGETYVDIAAPGCKVPVLTWDSNQQKVSTAHLSGTSMAAPIVSFVAAHLLGPIDSVERTKRRIMISSDYMPGLEGKIANGGRLNAVKALAFRFDVVETTDGALHFGYVDWQENLVCNYPYRRDQLWKLTRTASADEDVVIHLATLDDWRTDLHRCQRQPGELESISFRPLTIRDDDGSGFAWDPAIKIEYSRIKDITFSEPKEVVLPPPG
ncbi:S8 family serine peptidase [Skermanella pratensis]|uniref:S8 family serine peptidase n=1 Tax=Skermanella pratensis TaxID=2233999 RepID=UPI0013012052|nr:S8 family serine peptidase [Skermanella pratensis]